MDNQTGVEKAIDKAIEIFRREKNFHGDRSLLIVSTERHPKFFTKGYFIVDIEVEIEDTILKKSHIIYDEKSFIESRDFRLFISVYSLLAIAYIVGYVSNNSYLELAYFSPMILGYYYYKLTKIPLGSLLKKQADVMSFFLGMLTTSYLQFKVTNVNVLFFSFSNHSFSNFFVCATLHILCMFISVKFYISICELLESNQPYDNKFLQWIYKLFS